jgi:YjbE family integral membrane protein
LPKGLAIAGRRVVVLSGSGKAGADNRLEGRGNTVEILSAEFFSALLAIILIDLVLAGDNAIVIALAAKNLPTELRKRAVLWGTLGAIVVRSAMTLVVVWLLKIPGLMLAGGLLLFWIAFKLVAPKENGEGHDVAPATSFWAAMQTIVIADAVMGLDNVLAVAGAAHGSFLLVVIGLLVSIPIVIWGSSLILKIVDRHPGIVYLGGGVLVLTAAKMVASEPLIAPWVSGNSVLVYAFYVLSVVGVLGLGYAINQERRHARGVARQIALISTPAGSPSVVAVRQPTDKPITTRVLLPVDGTANSLQAARQVVKEVLNDPGIVEVHVVNVQVPFSPHVALFSPRADRQAWHRAQAEKAMRPVLAMLAKMGVAYRSHALVGPKAQTIVETADRVGATRIVMGTARKNSLTRLIECSVTNQVLELASVPVEVIAGRAVSPLERFGLPAGFAGAAALAVIAVE